LPRDKRPGFSQIAISPSRGLGNGNEPAIKAVILDFDGTVAVLNIDFAPIKEEILKLIEGYGVARESLGEKYLLETIDEGYSTLLRRERHSAEQFREKAHQMLVERELEAACTSRLLPGVESMLRKLKAAGLKVGIVTRNCDRAVRRIVPHIEALCDIFLSRDSVKRVKPDPYHLAAILDRRYGGGPSHGYSRGKEGRDADSGRFNGEDNRGRTGGNGGRLCLKERIPAHEIGGAAQ